MPDPDTPVPRLAVNAHHLMFDMSSYSGHMVLTSYVGARYNELRRSAKELRAKSLNAKAHRVDAGDSVSALEGVTCPWIARKRVNIVEAGYEVKP